MKKLLTAAVLIAVTIPVFAAKYATIGVTEAKIRTCGGESCAVRWKAWKYTPVAMLAVSKDRQWVQVKDFEGHTGWIFNTSLSTQTGLSAMVDLNVRATPSARGTIVCTVEKGYAFKFMGGKQNGWFQVTDDPANVKEGPCTGWVFGNNLWGPAVKTAAK